MRVPPPYVLIVLISCVACAGPLPGASGVAPAGPPQNVRQEQGVVHDSPTPFVLHPKLLQFTTPNVPPAKASVEHFKGGQWTENCDRKGIARVLQEGRKPPHTFTFVVAPRAAGRCEVLFSKGTQRRVLRVSVG